jgi:hypothetical protein
MANLKSRHFVDGTIEAASLADGTFTEAAVLAKFLAGSVPGSILKTGDMSQTKWDATALAREADLLMDNQTPTATAGKGVVLGVAGELLIEQSAVPALTVRTILGGTVYNHAGRRSVLVATAGIGAGIFVAGTNPGDEVSHIVVVTAAGVITVRAGASGVIPAADPALVAGDVPLARVRVANGIIAILNAMIVDLRNRKAEYGLKTEPLRAFGTITTAQMVLLFTTPILMVAAPAAGSYLEVVSCHWWLDYATAALNAPGGGDNLVVQYGAAAAGIVASGVLLALGWANAAADQHAIVPGIRPTPYSTVPPTAPTEPPEATGLYAFVQNANWANGGGATSVLKYDIYYRIRTFTPTW